MGFKMAGMLDSRKPHYCAICRNSLLIIHHYIKYFDRRQNYGPKSKFKMAAFRHLGFLKFDFCPLGLLRPLIFHLCTKFGAIMLINARKRPNYGPKSKFKMAAVRHLGFPKT